MEYTNKALKLMEEEKWYEAQVILREAVEKKPCCESYNNLGVFYIDNGIQHKNKKQEDGKELGHKYITMANYCDLEYKNLIALAEYNYYYGSLDEACVFYKKASEIKCDYRVYNNLACGCYKLGGYIKAVMYFDKALKNAEKNTDDIKISYCYSLLKCKEDYSQILESISSEKWTALDRCLLYYSNGDNKKAYELTREIIENWEFDLSVLAIIYDIIEKNNEEELNKFDDEVKELVKDKKARKEIIKDYLYTPVMLWQCKYIGCSKH